ncbi:hypothetical protein RDI58_001529 [Solanum bulbocastanum]|uniref:GRAS family transcription factor n=1 Tax=Solanum bulbocastanum TaxID=147425 RepID=A0AAN8YQ12_SOLBU
MESSLVNKGKDQMQRPRCAEEKKESSCLPSASCTILQKHYCGGEMREKPHDIPSINTSGSHVLSTVSIFEMARAQLHQQTSKKEDSSSFTSNTYCGLYPQALKDFELALLLQDSAEMFSKRHYDRATELLRLCNLSASPSGTSVQRVVYYFCEALQERIDKEKGTLSSNRPEGWEEKPFNLDKVLQNPKPIAVVCYQSSPFFQVPQFAGIQAIIDKVKSAKRVHLIDIAVKIGSHWAVLMQALDNVGDCPLELLKITAVATSKQRVEEIGQRLSSFAAENIKFPFSFKAVVSEMKDLSKDLFELDTNEVVAVYSEYGLGGMLAWPNHMESVLRLIKSLNPCIMVIIDTEANINAPIFMDRFNEALFLYGAFFDYLDVCMERDNHYRMTFEGLILRNIIQNIIICEGNERTFRNVRLEVWRDLFEKFGIKETELGESSLYQANLMADRCGHGFSTLDMNGKGLLIKWKGSPIIFASAWKFSP